MAEEEDEGFYMYTGTADTEEKNKAANYHKLVEFVNYCICKSESLQIVSMGMKLLKEIGEN